MESIAPIWSQKRPNACKSQKRRVVLGLYHRPVVLDRPDTINFFYFTKKTYIHIYNLYSILKTSQHNVLLVRQLHPVSPHFFQQGMGSNPTFSCTVFLIFYADLIKWTNGLTGRHDVPGPELWPAGVWPVSGRRRLAIYRRAAD
jgi:hypothetical protein